MIKIKRSCKTKSLQLSAEGNFLKTNYMERLFTLQQINTICEKFGFTPTVCDNEPKQGQITIQIEIMGDYFGEFVTCKNYNKPIGTNQHYTFKMYKP